MSAADTYRTGERQAQQEEDAADDEDDERFTRPEMRVLVKHPGENSLQHGKLKQRDGSHYLNT